MMAMLVGMAISTNLVRFVGAMRDMTPRPRKITPTRYRDRRARFTDIPLFGGLGKTFHEQHSVLTVQFVVDRAGHAP
jgi:hypothetical protein